VELLAELVVGHRRPRHADDIELGGQSLIARQVVDGRQQLALGQIARGPEDDERRRRRRGLDTKAVEERIRGASIRHPLNIPD
jgi:hypothetical protein